MAVAGDVGAWQGKFDAAGIDYLRIPLKGGPVDFAYSVRAARTFVKERGGFDVYHAHYRRGALLGRRLQKAVPAPLLYTVHLSHIQVGGLRRWFTDFGDFTHFASSDAMAWAQSHRLCTPERSRVIPHGIHLSRFRPPSPDERSAARHAMGVAPDARVAVYVGRLDDPKNVDWLLDVVVAWNKSDQTPLNLLVAGDGPHRARLERRIAREGLSQRVRLLGEVDPLPVYHAADMLMLASAREGFSYVCAEAMACGVPVLRTRTSGTSEMIREGVTGQSVFPIERDAFVRSAITFLKHDPEVLRDMGLAAAEHARERFAFERQLQQTIDLYRELRNGGGRKA